MMYGPILVLVVLVLMPLVVIIWNRRRVKGRMLCYFVRKDKSVIGTLCELRNDFVIFGDRAYDVYPDFVRVARFPSGWPAILQELVPCSLYDEEDAVPLNWISLDNRLERAMELKAALDENWLRKLVHETATEGAPAGFRFNWRKALPLMLVIGGIVGFIFIMTQGGGLPFFG